MLRVPIKAARPGMELAIPVRHPQRREHLLLQAGFQLDQAAITRLRDLRITQIWVRYPGLEFIGKYINPNVFEGQQRIGAALSDIFNRVARGARAKLDYPAYSVMIREFLDKLMQEPVAAVYIQELESEDRPLLQHSADVCFLSLLMGLKLEGYLVQQRRRLPPRLAKNSVNLGLGALFHDVGMIELDEQTLERWRLTRDESDPKWREHVRIGHQMVTGKIDPSAAAAVLHHHQRFDGSGFPFKPGHEEAQRGEEIHVFSRIIAVADIFDRLRRPPEGEPMPVVYALWRMRQADLAPGLDPMVASALVTVAPPYPPGSTLTLSDGTEGVVVEWDPTAPCRPTICPAGDLRAATEPVNVHDTRLIDLRERPELFVARHEDVDVSEWNFEPRWAEEFDLAAQERGVGLISASMAA